MGSEAEIESMVRAFEGGTLPRAEWTHRAHLIVALWYLHRHPRDEATRMISEGIRRHNARHRNDAGYHETVTLAWAAVVHGFLANQDRRRPLPDLARALIEAVGTGDYLRRFYSEGVLKSDEARRGWVPPDLRAIGPIDSISEPGPSTPGSAARSTGRLGGGS